MTVLEAGAGKPRLLVLASTYPRWAGDPEPGFVHELNRRLCEQFEVRVICPHAAGAARREVLDGVQVVRYRYAPSRLESLVNSGGMLHNLKRYPLKWLLLPFFLCAQLVAIVASMIAWRPAAVHAHWILPQGLMAALAQVPFRRPPPLLVTLHGSDLYRLNGRLATWLRRRVLARAQAVTVVSDAMKDALIVGGIDATSVRVAPMGVDFESLFTMHLPQIRDPNSILFVGRLVEGKGLASLVSAIPEVAAEFPDVMLRVVGDGPLRPVLQELATRLGVGEHVSFMGQRSQSELPDEYRRASVFAAPYDQAEGFGLVLIEAIACGCPIITSRLSPLADFVSSLSEVVTPGDVRQIAKALIATLEQPERARERARALAANAAEAFGWPAAGENYSALIHELVAGHTPSRV